jgi:hypothetical protein
MKKVHINAEPFAHTPTVGGSNGFRVALADRGAPERAMPSGGVLAGNSYSTNLANTYPFVSAPITIEPGAEQELFLDYVGTDPIRVAICAQKYSTIPNFSPGYVPPAESLVQSIELNFLPAEAGSAAFPSPRLE